MSPVLVDVPGLVKFSTDFDTIPFLSLRIRMMEDLLQPEAESSSSMKFLRKKGINGVNSLFELTKSTNLKGKAGFPGFLKNSEASIHSSPKSSSASAISALSAMSFLDEISSD